MTEVVTRTRVARLTPDDWSTLRRLRLAALANSPSAFLGDPEDELALGEQGWRSESERSRWFVAWRDGVPVGLGKLYRSADLTESMHIESMWVDPAARGSGVARALIEAMEAEARSLGEDRLGLWVFQGNPGARDMYRHLGYQGPSRVQRLELGDRIEVEEEYLKSLLP